MISFCIFQPRCCFSQNIEKSVPISDFDKDAQEALKLLLRDLYSLGDMHDKNMMTISKDVNAIIKKIKELKERMDVLEIKMELLREKNRKKL